MMQKQWYTFFFLGMLFYMSAAHAMVYDNRFFPLIGRDLGWYDRTPSQMDARFVAAVADRAFAPRDDEDHRLPEMFGVLDQGVLSDAMNLAGIPNPLPTAWQGREIIWRTDGKLQMEGLFLEGHHKIYRFLSGGYSVGMMHVRSYDTYRFERSGLILSLADRVQLDVYRRQMFQAIGVSGGDYGKTGLSDIDLYLRVGHHWDYTLKFKRITGGARVGVLIPSGVARNQAFAAAVPFGGDGFWGIYGAVDAVFEVKEDMKAGFFVQVNKRFRRHRSVRVPVLSEPQPLGVLYGSVAINPGVTGIFAPYVLLENLHNGLGAMIQYTIRVHQHDQWHDHCINTTLPLNFERVEQRTFWSSDTITLDLFYDFGKERISKGYDPFIFVRWDIPYKLLTSEGSAKTNQVSCGIGCSF